jgi:O-antigen ligase
MTEQRPSVVRGLLGQLDLGSSALVGRAAKLWGSSIPATAFLAVWGLTLAGFLLFAGRFAIVGVNFHGLPRHDTFLSFWLFALLSIGAGVVWGGRSALAYLAAFPVLMLVEGMDFLPFGQIPVHLFNFLGVGWLLRLVLRGVRELPLPRWPDFLVGCFGAAATIAALYGLAAPSWSNSFVVAFSAFSWNGEMNEFNALWMGHYLLAGCLLYFVVRTETERNGIELLHRVVLVQVILLFVVWVGIMIFLTLQNQEMSQASAFLALLSKQDIAGLGLLPFGYFLGIAAYPSIKPPRARLGYAFVVLCALFIMIISASKAALVAAPVVVICALLRLRATRIPLALALFGGVALLLTVLQFHGQKVSPYALSHSFQLLAKPSELIADSSSYLRMSIWKNSVLLASQFPIGGSGLGSSTTLLPHFQADNFQGSLDWNSYIHPGIEGFDLPTHNVYNCHNDFLEVAVSMGPMAALLLFAIYGFLMLLTWRRPSSPTGNLADRVASGLLLALIGYFLFSLFDSRIASFAGGLVFWQYVALGVWVTIPSDSTPKQSSLWWIPSLAPVLCAIGAIWVLGTSALPNDRVYGTWNWHMRDEDGRFLLAKEAGFVVPPFEELHALTFRLPDSSESDSATLLVQWDDSEPQSLEINKTSEARFPLDRKPDTWHRVRVISEDWCGRGILGLPLGVESYAVAMRKEKGNPPVEAATP